MKISEPISDPLMEYLAVRKPETIQQLRDVIVEFHESRDIKLPEVGEVYENVNIADSGETALLADIYRPTRNEPSPVLLYFHGGGWVMGSPRTHRRIAMQYAESGFLVISLDYRLAPEHPFPNAYNDCEKAIRWASDNAGQYGGIAGAVTLAGDSAGGNLAAALAATGPDDIRQLVRAVVLLYPALDLAAMNDRKPVVSEQTAQFIDMMAGSYIGHDFANLSIDPRVSPINSASELPPTYLLCGTCDAVCYEDTVKLKQLLEQAGITHEAAFYEGMPHGFAHFEEIYPQAVESVARSIDFLKNKTLNSRPQEG